MRNNVLLVGGGGGEDKIEVLCNITLSALDLHFLEK